LAGQLSIRFDGVAWPAVANLCFHTAVGEVFAAALDRVRNTSHPNMRLLREAGLRNTHCTATKTAISMLAPRSIPAIVSSLLHVFCSEQTWYSICEQHSPESDVGEWLLLSVRPCPGATAPARAETAILGGFGRHELQSVKLCVGDHDWIQGPVVGKRRKH
jgi:hypothetical protein